MPSFLGVYGSPTPCNAHANANRLLNRTYACFHSHSRYGYSVPVFHTPGSSPPPSALGSLFSKSHERRWQIGKIGSEYPTTWMFPHPHERPVKACGGVGLLSVEESALVHPNLQLQLLLGNVVLSAEIAARQAEERGHTFLVEIRIILLRGILHLIGGNGLEASKKMEEQEQQPLCRTEWKEKGLISDSLIASTTFKIKDEVGKVSDNKDADGILNNGVNIYYCLADWKAKHGANHLNRKRTSSFKLLFCDLDGTLLNSSSKITSKTAKAVRAAVQHGVQVIIATGKTRPASIVALRAAGLEGDGGAISLRSPGIFLQGSLVYKNGGSLLHQQTLNRDVCLEGFQFSVKHNIPLVGFCGDEIVTPFQHPLVDALHTVYYEPKAQVVGLVEDFGKELIQKLLFYSTCDTVASFLRPHWLSICQGRARIVQAIPEMLEILPLGVSKGTAIQMLLDELRVSPDEVMAIGDGENDIEMLKLAGLGVVMGNGAAQTIAVADAKVGSNDEDGVAEAIEKYILT